MSVQDPSNHCLNKKIKIYQMPLFERIMLIFSAGFMTSIPIAVLILGSEVQLEMVILLIAMSFFSVYMFFSVFMTYICVDITKGKVIIREFPGFRKQELPLAGLKEIKISTEQYNIFTIDFDYGSYSKKINSWSTHPSCRLAMFNAYNRQRARLNKFISKCEKYFAKD